MNRFKLFSVLIILGIVAILLGQNRELLSLKFFCPDITNQSCLYRSPALPLAAWIALFTLAGIISSLVWQFLSQVAPTSKSNKSNYRRSVENIREPQVDYTRPQNVVSSNIPTSDWEQPTSETWETDRLPKVPTDRVKVNKTTYQVPPEPRNLSDSSADTFREPKQSEPLSDRKNNKIDDVYDANYRTVSGSPPKQSNLNEEDEEWI